MKINRLAVLVLFPWMLTAQPSPPSGIPSGASLPAACSLGQTFMLTTASAGSNLYACTATNTWTAQAGGGGGGAVSSVFTRTGAVTATTGDYTAAQVTNAVDSTSTYSNPGWITALANAKITGLTAFATLATGASSTYVRGDATTQTLNFAALGGSAACSQLPASTGDATTSAGSCAYTVGKLNGTSLAGLATGLMKITTTTGVPSTATAGTDYVGGQANLSISGCVAYQTSNGILTCVSGLTWDGTKLNSPGGFASGGSSAGTLSLTANATPGSVVANSFGWTAPGTLTTAWYGSPPNASPIANQVMLFGAPSSNVSTWAWTSISGSGSFCMTSSCVMTTPNLGTPSAINLGNALALPASGLASISADNIIGNFSGSSGVPGTQAIPSCANDGGHALVYPSHTLTCETITGGGGGVTSVGGLTGVVPGGWILQEQHTASASAELDFTTCISSTYDDYVIRMINIVPSTSSTNFTMQLSTNGGSTYSTTTYNWSYVYLQAGATTTGIVDGASDSSFHIGNGPLVNIAGGTINLYNPAAGTVGMDWRLILAASGATYKYDGGAVWVTATAVNAFRFLFSAGNITSGTIRCYGIAKQ